VPQLENERHQRLAHLARVGLPVGKEVAANELHREGTAALLDAACLGVRERGPQHCACINPQVRVEAPIFDRFQRLREQLGNLVRRQNEPVFAVRREDVSDQERLELCDC
jgi:hypothetical protein